MILQSITFDPLSPTEMYVFALFSLAHAHLELNPTLERYVVDRQVTAVPQP
jgi:hypothetical protein